MNQAVRRIGFCAAAAALLLASTSALALTVEQRRLCESKNTGPDLRIVACTAVIDGKGQKPAQKAEAYSSRADAYSEKGDAENAIRDLGEAIKLNSQNSHALFKRGMLYRDRGQADAAIADLEMTLRQDKRNSAAMSALSHIYYDKREYARAVTTLDAQYLKFYQNVYPGNGPLSGAVNPVGTAVNLAAYNHTTNRNNVINQTDFVYKGNTGPFFHTFAFGTEFGRQTGIDVRNTGIFPNGTNTIIVDPLKPTYFGPVTFVHQFPGALFPGVTAVDGNSKYRLNSSSAYVRDTLEVTRWLQLIAGARFDRFDLSALDQNTGIARARVDNMVSPQAAVIFKPTDEVSIYGAYSVSYLPASGDQFSALNAGTVILDPQKFENTEVGVKWSILPRLIYTAAVYDLKRTNIPLADPNNPGFFILSGSNRIRGFETSLTGFVTNDWQTTLGYAYTDARVTSNTSATIVAGNRVQLVPFHQLSLWNKYQFAPAWAAALGVIYFSDSFASSDDSVILPGFVRFDVGLYWTIDKTWRAQFNIENVFNKGYWASADGNNNISPGQPRTFRISATASF